jgi:O-antigen ligase
MAVLSNNVPTIPRGRTSGVGIALRAVWNQPTRTTLSQSVVPKSVYWSFLFFVVTLPFESAPLDFTSESLSLAKVSGLLFFACYIWHNNPMFKRTQDPPAAFWWFLGYVGVYVLHGLFIDGVYFWQYLGRLLTLIQLLVLFWLTTRLLESPRIARHCVLAFAGSCSALGVGMIFGLPGFSTTILSNANIERETALGFDANGLATLLAVAAVMLIGLRLNTAFKHFVSKTALLVLALPLLVAIIQTGSRTGMGVFVIGCLIYLIPYYRAARKTTAFLLGGLGIASMVYLVLHDPNSLVRWRQAVDEGQLSGREKIAPTAIAMIKEQPILGWKPVEYQYELGRRLGLIWERKDAHNLYMHLLLEVGLLGAVPFLIGLYICGRAAWRDRRGNLGLMPLACLTTVLVANLFLTQLQVKWLWLILALTVGPQAVAMRARNRRVVLTSRLRRSIA